MSSPSHIRRLDTRTDLGQAADLIEISFDPFLDPDGRLYLRQIRKAAENQRMVKWSFAAGEWVSYPLNGFVWEEDNRIVGNLSIIPFYWKRQWFILIANVAVHPDFRRRGIAKELTRRAIEHLKHLRVSSIWLHVREENQIALQLYESFGFVERSRRDTWVSKEPFPKPVTTVQNVHISASKSRDWSLEQMWMSINYPPEIRWHLSFDPKQLKPGVMAALQKLFVRQKTTQLCAFYNNEPAGFAVWESSFTYADPVWLAVKPGFERVMPSLLAEIKFLNSPSRPIVINYPARKSTEYFLKSGFNLVNTLTWMELQSLH